MAEINFSRQGEWFEGHKFNVPVHIIGVGATGSFVALQLAKMGVREIHVYDFDVIEEHNVANQTYGLCEVGMQKVNALANRILEDTGMSIHYHDQKVDETLAKTMNGIVFILTDTMASRKEIFKAFKYNPRIQLVIETRMSINCGRIYAINPSNAKQVKQYEQTFYDDTEAEVSFCGSSLSIIPTAMNIASLACWKIIKFYLGKPIQNELLIDYENSNLIATTWAW